MSNHIDEQLFDQAINQALQTLQVGAGETREMQAKLEVLQKRIFGLLSTIDPTAVQRSGPRRARLLRFLDEMEALVKAEFKGIIRDFKKTILDSTKLQIEKTATELQEAFNVPLKSNINPKEFVVGIAIEGTPIPEVFDRLGVKITQNTADVVRQGMVTGSSITQMGKDLAIKDKVIQRNAEALVRTTIAAVNNGVREETFLENKDVIPMIQWVATLDSRTTDICRALDGKRWFNTTKKPVGHNFVYPSGGVAHVNERSVTVAAFPDDDNSDVLRPAKQPSITKKEAKEAGVKSKPQKRTTVPANITYGQWLKKLDKAQQKKILGPGRFKLFNEGKLKVEDLVDKNLNPLTIKELKRLK